LLEKASAKFLSLYSSDVRKLLNGAWNDLIIRDKKRRLGKGNMRYSLKSFGKIFWLTSLIAFSVLGSIPLRSTAVQATKIYLNPPSISLTLVGEIFQLNLTVFNGTDLYAWQARVSWDINHLNLTSATEGPFLKGLLISTYFLFNPNYLEAYADIACTRLGEVPGVNGTGTLATLTFKAVEAGESDINLSLVKIIGSDASEDYPPAEGTHVTGPPGPPKVEFAWTPEPPTSYLQPSEKPLLVDKPVTFNATYERIGNKNYGSYDPDGGSLTNYKWDFGDGNVTSGPYPIIVHTYNATGGYWVTLNVTDDEGATNARTQQVQIALVDVAIIDVKPSTTQVLVGENVIITVTLKNLGTIAAKNVNITAYYFNSTLTGKIGNETLSSLLVPPWYEAGQGPFYTKDVEITWQTTGLSLGAYTIKANLTQALWGENNLTNNEFINGNVTLALVSIIPYSVTVGGVIFKGEIATNSSISRSGAAQLDVTGPINFNATAKELSFNATSASGTVGFCNVTIPQKLLNATPPTAWIVLLNGSSIEPPYSLTTNATHSFLYFTYNHSTSKIQIIGTSVATPPVASFTASNTKPWKDELIYFNAMASYDPLNGTIQFYHWDFGDGNKTTVTVPIIYHAYQSVQDFTVTLTVTDNDGLNTTLSRFKYIQVQKRDIAVVSVEISPTSVPVGEIVTISVTVKNNGDIVETFDVIVYYDNVIIETYSVVNLPIFTPLNPTANVHSQIVDWDTSGVAAGNYAIKVDATIPGDANLGDNSKIGGIVKVMETPIAEFTPSKTHPMVGETVTFNATESDDPDGRIISYKWDFDDRTGIVTETDPITTHSFASVGTFLVTLTVTDNDNLTDAITVQIIVEKIPSVISLTISPGTITIDETATLSGTISPVRSGVAVTLQYRAQGVTTWTTIPATVTTNQTGGYSYAWEPQSTGKFEVRALWNGDSITLGDESDLKTLTVQSAPLNIVFIVGGAIAVIAIVLVVVYFLKLRKLKPTM